MISSHCLSFCQELQLQACKGFILLISSKLLFSVFKTHTDDVSVLEYMYTWIFFYILIKQGNYIPSSYHFLCSLIINKSKNCHVCCNMLESPVRPFFMISLVCLFKIALTLQILGDRNACWWFSFWSCIHNDQRMQVNGSSFILFYFGRVLSFQKSLIFFLLLLQVFGIQLMCMEVQ